jgi:hypothetical protein
MQQMLEIVREMLEQRQEEVWKEIYSSADVIERTIWSVRRAELELIVERVTRMLQAYSVP